MTEDSIYLSDYSNNAVIMDAIGQFLKMQLQPGSDYEVNCEWYEWL